MASVPNIVLKEFDPRKIEKRRLGGNPATIAVFGKRSTGKSVLIRDLMFYIKGTPFFLCMSGTEEGNGFYKNHIHPLFIYGGYQPDVVKQLIKNQKKKLKNCIKSGVDPATDPSLGVGLLLDDCAYDKKIMNSEDMRLLFMNGRHWKIGVVASFQYMKGIPPDLRTNIDYVFCLKENINDNQKKLYTSFFGNFTKFSHFQEAFVSCTENYGCIVLDNTIASNKIEDCVFHYKANPNRTYRIGTPELWRCLDESYNEDDESDEDTSGIKKTAIVKKTGIVKPDGKLIKKQMESQQSQPTQARQTQAQQRPVISLEHNNNKSRK